MQRPPMILISRRPREIGGDWKNARSWLGGAPRLGELSWPRNDKGAPLHFAAQIDLAEVAEKAPDTPLPKEGSLAFFIGDARMVLFVPDHHAFPPDPAPDGMSDLTTVGGDPRWPFDPQGRALFPFWPIAFTRIQVDGPNGPTTQLDEDDCREECYAAQSAAIGAHFLRREYNLSSSRVFAGPPIPDWWRCAIHLADELGAAVRSAPNVLQGDQRMLAYTQGKLEEARHAGSETLKPPQSGVDPGSGGDGALNRLLRGFRTFADQNAPKPASDPIAQRNIGQARRQAAEAITKAEASVALYENRIARLHRLLPGLKEFAAEVADWTRGRDPWSLMTPEDRARLGRYWARKTEFPEYTGYYGVTPLDYLKQKMFEDLPGADDPTYETLPEDVRAVIAGRRAPRPQWWRPAILFAEELEKKLAGDEPHQLESKRRKLAAAGPEKTAALAELEAQVSAFRRLAKEVSALTRGREPWSPMPAAETALLVEKLERMQKDCREIASSYHVRYEDFEGTTLVALASADDAAYATLPEHARALINREYLLPIDIPHQMFGFPVFIQGDACAQAEEGKHLLLQLGFDDLMFWSFGDNGDYQFWISPEDLARRNWDAVTMTFECH